MAIYVNEEKGLFQIDTKNASYQMKVSKSGYLLHTYYGRKIKEDVSGELSYYDRGFSGNPPEVGTDRRFSLDALPQEYSCYGQGDYRNVAFLVKDKDGVFGCHLKYDSYEVDADLDFALLPHIHNFEGREDIESLKIRLKDKSLNLYVDLYYHVLPYLDVIARSVVVTNAGEDQVFIEKIASGQLDFLAGDFDLLHFHGRHCKERQTERIALTYAGQSIGSLRGTSSHQENPFLILADRECNEEQGDCYGLHLLYSGNFHMQADKDQYAQTRLLAGIHEEMFSYRLDSGETFISPQLAITFSKDGLTGLSHNCHSLIRYHICRGKFQTQRRPVLLNNWEATYFDFDGEKIKKIAKQASELGVEMLVLDDGWFGKRDSDNSGLGDWWVNEEKIGSSLKELGEGITAYGMKFGLWIEPEMVSEDSDLYRNHPDFAFCLPGKEPVRSRNQLVLDFSRKEVVDYIYQALAKVISTAPISYLKMDMNRSICDVYSRVCRHQNHGEIMYKYVLGVYDFLDRISKDFPDLFVEGCSGGGGRFDAGMLYYTPQIWCSDNTDAVDRLFIQNGTSYGYPISSVGSHVSIVPNHQTGRLTDLKTRAIVAMAGSFGYELDLSLLSDEEKEAVKDQIIDYKKYWNLIQNGHYYRCKLVGSAMDASVWMFVSEDKSEGLLNVVTLDTNANGPAIYVRARGLDENKVYQVEGFDKQYSGASLMHMGLLLPLMQGEYQALQIYFKEVRD
ncbi:MAG TPA: alpha-galactosidase [Lachnospiraceae bacterium]